MWSYCLCEFWNFQYVIRMNCFVFASRYKLYVCYLNDVYAENLPDTTSWHKCQCICYIWGVGSGYSDWDVWCSWWNCVFLDWLHCGTSGDLSCSECSDILHGSLEAWWVVIPVGICSVLLETVFFRVGFAVVHLMMCLGVKCWDTINIWVAGSCVVFLRKLHFCSANDEMFSCKREDVLYQKMQVETGLVRLFWSWITEFSGRDPTAWVNG